MWTKLRSRITLAEAGEVDHVQDCALCPMVHGGQLLTGPMCLTFVARQFLPQLVKMPQVSFAGDRLKSDYA